MKLKKEVLVSAWIPAEHPIFEDDEFKFSIKGLSPEAYPDLVSSLHMGKNSQEAIGIRFPTKLLNTDITLTITTTLDSPSIVADVFMSGLTEVEEEKFVATFVSRPNEWGEENHISIPVSLEERTTLVEHIGTSDCFYVLMERVHQEGTI